MTVCNQPPHWQDNYFFSHDPIWILCRVPFRKAGEKIRKWLVAFSFLHKERFPRLISHPFYYYPYIYVLLYIYQTIGPPNIRSSSVCALTRKVVFILIMSTCFDWALFCQIEIRKTFSPTGRFGKTDRCTKFKCGKSMFPKIYDIRNWFRVLVHIYSMRCS